MQEQENQKKCAYSDCLCTVKESEQYCSSQCAREPGSGICKCGHSDCQHGEVITNAPGA